MQCYWCGFVNYIVVDYSHKAFLINDPVFLAEI